MNRSPQQAMYDEIVAAIAALLKRRGFAKRGHRFGLRQGENWGVVDFQKHHLATTRDSIQFAINLGVWLRFLENKPCEWAPSIGECHWSERVLSAPTRAGQWPLPPEKWWIVDDESVPGYLPPLVSAAVEWSLPMLTERLDDANFVSLYRERKLHGIPRLTLVQQERLDRMTQTA